MVSGGRFCHWRLSSLRNRRPAPDYSCRTACGARGATRRALSRKLSVSNARCPCGVVRWARPVFAAPQADPPKSRDITCSASARDLCSCRRRRQPDNENISDLTERCRRAGSARHREVAGQRPARRGRQGPSTLVRHRNWKSRQTVSGPNRKGLTNAGN